MKARKREVESFSDVVIRLTEGDDVHEGFGLLAGTDIEEAVREAKAEMHEDFERRTDEMYGQ